PRWGGGRAGDVPRRRGRRARARSRVLRRFQVVGPCRAPDPPRRRRLLDRFVLLSVGVMADPAPALWATVVAIGAWHGVNPGMGWPLAVANGLGERRSSAVFATLLPLGAGHFLAMAVVLVPFTMLSLVLAWHRPI